MKCSICDKPLPHVPADATDVVCFACDNAKYYVRVDNPLFPYVHLTIDSSGMDAMWVNDKKLASEFDGHSHAFIMLGRIRERFAHRKFELEKI